MSCVADGPATLVALHDGRRAAADDAHDELLHHAEQNWAGGQHAGHAGHAAGQGDGQAGHWQSHGGQRRRPEPVRRQRARLRGAQHAVGPGACFVGVKVLEFLHMYESIDFSWPLMVITVYTVH